MARAAKLSDMITAVRELADLVGAESRAPDAMITRRLNDHLAKLYDKLRKARPAGYYATETPAHGAAGAMRTVVDRAVYTLPYDFLELLAVRATDGTTTRMLTRWEEQEVEALLRSTASATIYTYRYRLTAAGLEIRPAPTSAAHTLVLRYVPAFVPLAATGGPDSFDGVNGWERFAVLGAAIDLLNAEQATEEAAVLAAERSEEAARIAELAEQRDAARPPRMQDVERSGALASGFFEGWSFSSFDD